MNKQELYKKITKLLELANSSTYEGEREAAKLMAAKLITKYDITDFNPEDVEFRKVALRDYPELCSARLNHYIFDILNLCGEHTGVVVVWTGSYGWDKICCKSKRNSTTVTLFGRNVDVEHTLFLFKTLYYQYKRKLDTFSGKGKVSYKRGLIAGIQELFEEIAKDVIKYKQQEGLVLVDDAKVRRKKAEDKFGDIRLVSPSKIKISDPDAYQKGLDDAATIHLNAGINKQSNRAIE